VKGLKTGRNLRATQLVLRHELVVWTPGTTAYGAPQPHDRKPWETAFVLLLETHDGKPYEAGLVPPLGPMIENRRERTFAASAASVV
jgi:hypothetical protein